MAKYLKINGKVCLDTWRGMLRLFFRGIFLLKDCVANWALGATMFSYEKVFNQTNNNGIIFEKYAKKLILVKLSGFSKGNANVERKI